MKKTVIATLISALAAPAWSAGGAAWLAYPGSAANVAEAGGLGVMASGSESLGLNPAGLASLESKGEIRVGHSSWAADIRSENAALAVAGPAGGVLGLQGRWIDFGAVQGYRLGTGGVEETQVLRPSAGQFSGAWAGSFGSALKLGLGGGMLMQNLDGEHAAWAPSFEGGATLGLPGSMRASLALVNVGTDLDGSAQPTQARLGLALAPAQSPLMLGVEAAEPIGGQAQPDVAAALRISLAQALVLRLGWQQLSGADGAGSAGMSFRVGGAWDVDYGFKSQGALGASHHLSLAMKWG